MPCLRCESWISSSFLKQYLLSFLPCSLFPDHSNFTINSKFWNTKNFFCTELFWILSCTLPDTSDGNPISSLPFQSSLFLLEARMKESISLPFPQSYSSLVFFLGRQLGPSCMSYHPGERPHICYSNLLSILSYKCYFWELLYIL